MQIVDVKSFRLMSMIVSKYLKFETEKIDFLKRSWFKRVATSSFKSKRERS